MVCIEFILVIFMMMELAETVDYNKSKPKTLKDVILPFDADRLSDAINMSLYKPTTFHFGPNRYGLPEDDDSNALCPSSAKDCSSLSGDCIQCNFNKTCVYGQKITVDCRPKQSIKCKDPRFTKTMVCQYCFQADERDYICSKSSNCKVVSSNRERYISNCTVHPDIICMGSRRFQKSLVCNWTSGYRWSTALILSITLGGFGADRFYLGHWQEGIGKVFSFGGLGIWTLIDVILIAIGYIGPADKSLYI